MKKRFKLNTFVRFLAKTLKNTCGFFIKVAVKPLYMVFSAVGCVSLHFRRLIITLQNPFKVSQISSSFLMVNLNFGPELDINLHAFTIVQLVLKIWRMFIIIYCSQRCTFKKRKRGASINRSPTGNADIKVHKSIRI